MARWLPTQGRAGRTKQEKEKKKNTQKKQQSVASRGLSRGLSPGAKGTGSHGGATGQSLGWGTVPQKGPERGHCLGLERIEFAVTQGPSGPVQEWAGPRRQLPPQLLPTLVSRPHERTQAAFGSGSPKLTIHLLAPAAAHPGLTADPLGPWPHTPSPRPGYRTLPACLVALRARWRLGHSGGPPHVTPRPHPGPDAALAAAEGAGRVPGP